MTTHIALWLAAILVALIAIDHFQDWGGGLFVARRGINLIQNLALWR